MVELWLKRDIFSPNSPHAELIKLTFGNLETEKPSKMIEVFVSPLLPNLSENQSFKL
jgi:hypothetical protein